MKNKRGGIIAEAAIVFPVIILSMMAILYILIRMYINASESTCGHLALRLEAGHRAGTVIREEGLQSLTPEDRFGRGAFRKTPGIYDAGKLFDNYIFTEESRCYIIDETEYIRKSDLLKGIVGNEEENFE